MSIELIKNANKIIKQRIYQRETQANYKSLQEKVTNGYASAFTTEMQSFVVRIALMVSEVIVNVKFNQQSYFTNAVNYLCNDVLNDKNLLNGFSATKLNENANKYKHSLDEININIEQCVNQYNRLINQLVAKLKLDALNIIRIAVPKTKVIASSDPVSAATDPIKKTTKPKPIKPAIPKQKSIESKKPIVQSTKPAQPKFILNDPTAGTLIVELVRGNGLITKHSLFGKSKKCMHFILKVSYNKDFKIKSLTATTPLKESGYEEIPIKVGDNELEFDLEKYKFPEIRITVRLVIRLRAFTTKELVCTVARNF